MLPPSERHHSWTDKTAFPLALLCGLIVANSLLGTLNTQIVPSLVNPYSPSAEGDVPFPKSNDPPMGAPIPDELNPSKRPRLVVFHAECLSCSLAAYEKAKVDFDQPDVENVIATDPDSYTTLIQSHRERTRVVGEGIVKRLNVAFSPRLYAYDERGRLAYVQDLQEALPDAISNARKLIGLPK